MENEVDIIDDSDFDAVVQSLRDSGFKWKPIAQMMQVKDKQLYRWRKKTGFDNKAQNVPIEVKDFLEENVRRGEKITHGHLLSLGIKVTRKRLRECIESVDPEGVPARKIRRLKRRVYSVPGPHYLWHMDGCHKLIKFGIVVHAAIDGFSRYIVFIKASDNNRANTVLTEFKGGCRAITVLPHRMRTDKGGENRNVCRFLLDTFGADSNCCITGKSTGNQRGERLFRDSTELALSPYVDLFEDFVLLGFDVDNRIQMFILHYLFMKRINESISDFREAWNNHGVRTEHNKTPIQILIEANLEGKNCGVLLEEEDLSILDNETEIPVEYYDNQVVCDSPYVPFNEQQMQVFIQLVSPITKMEGLRCENLFPRVIHTIAIANDILAL